MRLVKLDEGPDFDADLIPTATLRELAEAFFRADKTRDRINGALTVLDDLSAQKATVNGLLTELRAELKARL